MNDEIRAFADTIAGPVFLPDDEGYDVERAAFQTFGPHRPDLIIGVTATDEVRAAVAFASKHELPVAVQATGHGLPTSAKGGLLITTRRLTEVSVDAERRVARLEAGVRWNQVIETTAPHGLAPLSGTAPQVSAVPYILGGGIGLMSRRYGYAADHVRSIDVVTADAQLRHVTADSDPDLFWALRGGEGNFGVVTGLEIDLMPVSHLFGGGLIFDAPLAGQAFRAWQLWSATVPEELTSSVVMMRLPDFPEVPEPLRGRHVLHIQIAFLGDAATGDHLVAPLREVGPRLLDMLGEMPYAETGAIHNSPTQPMAYYATNTMLRDLDEPAVRTLVDLTGPEGTDQCVVEVRHLGGALTREPAVGNAVGGRQAQYLLGLISPLSTASPGDAELDAVRTSQRRVLEAMAPWSTGGTCLNFLLGENTSVEHVRTAYDSDSYQRLTELKARYDPANLFRHNRNIPPALDQAGADAMFSRDLR